MQHDITIDKFTGIAKGFTAVIFVSIVFLTNRYLMRLQLTVGCSISVMWWHTCTSRYCTLNISGTLFYKSLFDDLAFMQLNFSMRRGTKSAIGCVWLLMLGFLLFFAAVHAYNLGGNTLRYFVTPRLPRTMLSDIRGFCRLPKCATLIDGERGKIKYICGCPLSPHTWYNVYRHLI